MKKLFLLLFFVSILSFAQAPQNSLLKNFKSFETPRTNNRPGTVYRINQDGVQFIVQDIPQIKSDISNDGTLIGQMTFSKDELLTMLNINFNTEFVTVEVEIKDAEREFTEQANVDLVLWENDIAKQIMRDEKSTYYLIRETVASQNISFRFDKNSYLLITTGKSNLKEKTGEGIDFIYELTKKFNEPKRLFYLEEKLEIK
ncbi:MAG: hypothetical protein COW71_06875 [Ignavibacteriales bacterium CG18_big_fil_WC_8_21_14_2_50_31_20]|nr:MAG: hypothetical protein COW71_06875 [Ignavibacteriales bacterium CG18_big_fil_WC_8_21_14_2_50_31_20]